MKNVRLFAVAAALGMFASTVAAAETTKTVTWSGSESVIKVDLGEKLIVSTPKAVVTSSEETVTTGSIYAVDPEVNKQGWLHTNTMYWTDANLDDAYKALTLNGGRVLKPGAEESDEGVFYSQITGEYFADCDEAFAYLEETGAIKVAYDEDGNIYKVVLNTVDSYYQYNTETSRTIAHVVTTTFNRRSDDYIRAAVANYFANGTLISSVGASDASYYTQSYVKSNTVASTTKQNVVLKVRNGGTDAAPTYKTILDNTVATDYDTIYVVQNRKGDYSYVGVGNAQSPYTVTAVAATASDVYSTLNPAKQYVLTATNAAADTTIVNESYFYKNEIVHIAADGLPSSDFFGAYNEEYALTKGTNSSGSYAGVLDAIVWVETGADGAEKIPHIVTVDQLQYFDGTKLVAVPNGVLVQSALDAGDYYYGGIKLTAGTNAEGLVAHTYAYLETYNSGYAWNGTSTTAGAIYYPGYQLDSTSPLFYLKNETYKRVMNEGSTYYKVRGADVPNGAYTSVDGLHSADYINVIDITDLSAASYTIGAGDVVTLNKTVDTDGLPGFDDVDGTALRVNRIAYPKDYRYDTIREGYFNFDSLTFDYSTLWSSTTAATTDISYVSPTATSANTYNNAAILARRPHTNGLFYLETPENDSDKYVLFCGAENGLDLVYSVNTSKETITIQDAEGEDLTVAAVELDRKWYPAFDTEEELKDFVFAVTGVDTALEGDITDKRSTFYNWYYSAIDAAKAMGISLPTKAATEETKVVDSTSTDVKVTSNIDTIDTTVAGVYDLVYTANYNGEALEETHTVKVVVAPNYAREYKNGKVVKLTSFYVSNPTAKYAEYNYDWDAKKVTVTYYNVDGSVADTATNSL